MNKIINHFENIIDRKKEGKIMDGGRVFSLGQLKSELKKVIKKQEDYDAVLDILNRHGAI